MAQEQPEESPPAAGVPDPTRMDDGSDSSTVDAPVRWSGSATVPAASPKRQWWRREDAPQPAPHRPTATPVTAGPEEPTPVDPWAATAPVDPWAGHDTPWEPFPIPMPPTRIEPPAPTKVDPPPAAATPPPAPAPPAVTAPKLSKRDRKRLEQATVNRLPVQTRPAGQPPAPPAPPSGPIVQGRRLPAPPPWAPRTPARPLPPPRRKRRWGRRLALLSLLGAVLCCGLPFAWFQVPEARQYPVSAALPQSFADLQLRDTEDTGADGFAGVYRDGRGKRVTVIGETGFRLRPGSDVRGRLDQATADYNLKNVQEFDLGESGAHQRCGVGRDDGASVVVCAWADHGSLATVLLTRRSVADSAELVARLREEVLTPG